MIHRQRATFDPLQVLPRRWRNGWYQSKPKPLIPEGYQANVQDYIMLCLDTGPSMDAAPLEEQETRLATGLRIASRIVQQKARRPQLICMMY